MCENLYRKYRWVPIVSILVTRNKFSDGKAVDVV